MAETSAKGAAKGVETLREGLRGELVLPQDAAYESARRIWNAMIDKRPAAIVRCGAVTDVVRAVEFARASGMPLAVRGGGHHIAGNALCDDGVVIDFSAMKAVSVDADGRRASVEAGATLGDVDGATQAHGLATPLGINSTTGVAGLTLGGGFGWLSRRYGMTVDNLEWAEVVTAAGKTLRASEDEHPDLFWALRGGGGNFGVVTRFGFRLHRVGPQVLAGLIVYPFEEAKQVLQRFREFTAKAPDELAVWAVVRLAPPLPFLPESAHGKPIVALALLYAGEPARGLPLVEPLRGFGTPLGEHIAEQPYAGWQKTFDPLLAPGARNYWKSHNFSTLADGLFDATMDAITELPSPQCEIFFGGIGGAASRVAPDATAYAHRETQFAMNVHGRWEQPEDDARCVRWAREFFEASQPFALGSVYVNFLTADESDRVRAAYGPNYDRLAKVKATYDPDNLFRVNQNIRPS